MLTLILLLTTPAQADCAPVNLKQVTRDARAALEDALPELALSQVLQADQALGCLDTLASVDDLGALYQVGGTAALRLGQDEQAQALFATGARMAGAVPFDVRLGASAQGAWQSQLDFVRNQDRATVLAHTPVRLDGLDLALGQARQVPAGGHLIQQVDGAALVRSELRPLEAGSTFEIGQAPTVAEEPRRRPVGLAVSGLALTLGGGACLYDLGLHQRSLGALESRADLHERYYPDNPWPRLSAERERLEQTSTALKMCGLTGVSVGSAILGASLVLTNQSITLTKSW